MRLLDDVQAVNLVPGQEIEVRQTGGLVLVIVERDVDFQLHEVLGDGRLLAFLALVAAVLALFVLRDAALSLSEVVLVRLWFVLDVFHFCIP